jgi:hypothetical protein
MHESNLFLSGPCQFFCRLLVVFTVKVNNTCINVQLYVLLVFLGAASRRERSLGPTRYAHDLYLWDAEPSRTPLRRHHYCGLSSRATAPRLLKNNVCTFDKFLRRNLRILP